MTVALQWRYMEVSDPDARPSLEPHPYLEDFEPRDPAKTWFTFRVEIGPADEDGADVFYGRFATVAAMKENEKEITQPHWSLPDHVIVMPAYSYEGFAGRMAEILKSCEDKTWLHSVRNLMKYFQWEFAGMHVANEGDFDADGNVTPQGRARQNEIEPLPWERADWVE